MAKPAIQKGKLKPLADTEWVVVGYDGFYRVKTKDSRHLPICRAYSEASARLIVKEHNTALAQREAGATRE